MSKFIGVVIEESLENTDILQKLTILSTRTEKVTLNHQTPWLSQWTLHDVEIPCSEAAEIAEEVRNALDRSQPGSWYADFNNKTHHYIIFCDRVFYVDRRNGGQYDEAKAHGLELGIPEHQVDFHPDVEVWER
ncbi:MAG: hypothetical protein O3B95_08730 [Chloroflexi bacterium]|nr:hypothetical protein [Chloroflexota bacterium]